FEAVEPLAGSGLFSAYRVRERGADAARILHVPRPHLLGDAASVERFRDLMGRVRQVSHPGIARVHEVGGEGAEVWLLSDAVDAPTLRDLLVDGLALGIALDAVASAADALEALHRAGVHHADVTARNIHLMADGRARVANTGVAALAEAVQPLMRASLQTPAPAYMAPELLRGARPSAQTDLYSLALVLYEVVTGHLPFSGNSPETVRVKQDEVPIRPPSE